MTRIEKTRLVRVRAYNETKRYMKLFGYPTRLHLMDAVQKQLFFNMREQFEKSLV